MAKRTRIEPALFQCPICKKKYFSFIDRMWCPECAKETEENVGSDDAEGLGDTPLGLKRH